MSEGRTTAAGEPGGAMPPVLQIDDLRVYFRTDAGLVKAVDGVSFEIRAGETLAVVGESGCGKSVTAMSVLGLVPSPPGEVVSGRILLRGEDLVHASDERLREIRGDEIAMIFQEPMTSLNPVFTVGDQIGEALMIHRECTYEQAREYTLEMLRRVGIPAPEVRIDEYPHQMSGGMSQRVMIAMALVCRPGLLIADEPTTALDVTIQAQILALLRELQIESDMSILLITHDLGVVAEVAQRVVVMYAGNVVESAEVKDLFERPRHPYTAGLFHSIPRLHVEEEEELEPIEGNVPDALRFPSGCKFHPRCRFALERCSREDPTMRERGSAGPGSHRSACWYVDEHPEADLLALRASPQKTGEAVEVGEGAS